MLRLRDVQWERIREHFPEEHIPDSGPGRIPSQTSGLGGRALDFEHRRAIALLAAVGLTKRGKGVKILAIVDRHGLTLSVSTHAANHHEVTSVELSFDFYMLEAKPEHLIGDRAYDGDGLDDDLEQDGVNMIAPHRSTRKLETQDGRHLRRYERRWLVERFFAWLQ